MNFKYLPQLLPPKANREASSNNKRQHKLLMQVHTYTHTHTPTHWYTQSTKKATKWSDAPTANATAWVPLPLPLPVCAYVCACLLLMLPACLLCLLMTTSTHTRNTNNFSTLRIRPVGRLVHSSAQMKRNLLSSYRFFFRFFFALRISYTFWLYDCSL